jgi:hypothetical protein
LPGRAGAGGLLPEDDVEVVLHKALQEGLIAAYELARAIAA